MPTNRVVDHPVILGIVGDSAAGKTTLTAGIAAILGADRVACICADDYHRYSRRERTEHGVTALNPAANYIDILEQQLKLLRQGQPILKPVYDHHDGSLAAPEYIAPKPYIIVEGLLAFHTRAMRDCFDVKTYLDPEESLRVQWKVQRDTAKRGYRAEDVRREIMARERDTANYIRPQRTFADIIINFHRPEGNREESGSQLNVRQVLRPTLPHPDLNPILEQGSDSELHLALLRDTDGKPVDVVEIAGSISTERARALENLLWSLIPEAGHLKDNVGAFEQGGNRMSHPLALTQLIIAYHMVKAAMGEHAV